MFQAQFRMLACHALAELQGMYRTTSTRVDYRPTVEEAEVHTLLSLFLRATLILRIAV